MNYVKAAIGVAVLGALGLFAVQVHSWRRDALALPAAVAATAQIRANFDQYQRNTAAEAARVNNVAQGYQHELEALRADRGDPIRLRVPHCPAPTGPAAVNPAPAPGPDAAAAGAGGVPEAGAGDRGQGGIDIGPDLEQLARDADAVTAIARGLQVYVSGLPRQCLIAPE